MATISVIIPTCNEAENIGRLVSYINQHSYGSVIELIVSDSGSEDDTLQMASDTGAHAMLSPKGGRSAQMNYGASIAHGDVLYFLHADCFPPASFVYDIQQAIHEGYDLGRYQTKFDSSRRILKLNAWFTRFDLFICMGGDQTLFIKRSVFNEAGGFKEDMRIMEEYEFCQRVRANHRYKIMRGKALISARKYDTNSWWRVQKANATVVRMYKRGAPQQQMVDTYKRLLSYRKNAFENVAPTSPRK